MITLFIHIKCKSYENVCDIIRACDDVAMFLTVYFKIRVEICNVQLENHPLIKGSIRSAIATVTNCILLLEANHQGLSDSVTFNQSISNRMDKLRDHMAKVDLGFDFPISVEQFLVQRSLGNFDINSTKNLYSVTTNIKQIRSRRTERTLNETQGDDLWELDGDTESYDCRRRTYLDTDDETDEGGINDID